MTTEYTKGIKNTRQAGGRLLPKKDVVAQTGTPEARFLVEKARRPLGGLLNTQVTEDNSSLTPPRSTDDDFNDYLSRCFEDWENWLADHALRRTKRKLDAISKNLRP